VPKKTPAQHFAQIFALFTAGATEGERAAAERKMDAWLKRHAKTRADIPSILVQAAADDAAAQPSPPPSDPRDAAPHPYEDPQFTPAGLVEGITSRYVTMQHHVLTIFALWICLTHVYLRFAIAPRVALISEEPDSGKTTASDVARHLVFRPNPESLGTGAAIGEFLDQGPCTILLDELDQVDAEGRRRLQLIWNLGTKRGAKYAMVVRGKRKIVSLYAPVLAAGVGNFLAPTQKSRTFNLEMQPYTEDTKPECEYTTEEDFSNFDHVYSYLHNWAARVKLNPKPPLPPSILRRFGDNVRGLLSVADSCGPEWGQRAREAIMILLEKERAERPQIIIIRHGLLIFDVLELDRISSVRFNKELLRLDLPDARWNQYRGASGTDYAHPLRINEQAELLRRVGVTSEICRPPGKRQPRTSFRGYKRAAFEEAQRKFSVTAPDETELQRGRLRLSGPSD
jgi:Protein of unknown function (DUF3631)